MNDNNNSSLQQHTLNEQILGQMDAMELTPSVSSSHKRNRSQLANETSGHEGNGNGQNGRLFTVNRFNDLGNGAKEDQVKDEAQGAHEIGQSRNSVASEMGNDSIMNPAIQRGVDPTMTESNVRQEKDNRRGLRDPNDDNNQQMIRETNNIQIMENYQYKQNEEVNQYKRAKVMNIQESSSQNLLQGSARATISLTQLQAQADQQPFLTTGLQSVGRSSHQTPQLTGRAMQPASALQVSDGNIAGTSQASGGQLYGLISQSQPSNFEQLNFDKIEQEEQFLDEQYRLLSQNQRAVYKVPGSKDTGSAATSQRVRPASHFMQQSADMSQRSNQAVIAEGESQRRGHHSRNISTDRGQTQSQHDNNLPPHRGSDGPDHHKARSMVVSGKQPMRNSRNTGHNTATVSNNQNFNTSSQANSNSQGAAHASMSQQSLLNRNTSPFNRRRNSNNSASDQMMTASHPSAGTGPQTMQRNSEEPQYEQLMPGNTSLGLFGSGPDQNISRDMRIQSNDMTNSQPGGTFDQNVPQMQHHQRSASNHSNLSHSAATSNFVCNEENFRRLQTKIRDQAKRLVDLQKQLKHANLQISMLSEVQVANNTSASQVVSAQKQVEPTPVTLPDQSRASKREVMLESQLKQKDEAIDELQKRNLEISKGIINQTDLQQRLQRAENNLLHETALNEEQRAQIAILKEGIEHNLERVGLRFSHQHNQQFAGQKGPLNQIDGYLQLMRFAQLNEELKTKVQILEDKLQTFNDKAQSAMNLLEARKNEEIAFVSKDYRQQLDSKKSLIDVLSAEKKNIAGDKDQLLDFAEKSQAKEKQLNQQIKESKDEIDKLRKEINEWREKMNQKDKEKRDQEELLRQVKDNLTDMRNDREKLTAEVQELKKMKEILEQRLEERSAELTHKLQENDQFKDILREYQEQKGMLEIETGMKLESKDEELGRLRSQMKDYQESNEQKEALIEKQRAQLQSQKTKIAALEQSKENLKRTLKESQQELTKLVDVHEKLTAKQTLKTQDALQLSSEVNQLKAEVLKKKQIINQYQRRLEEKDADLNKYQEKLAQKNREHLENEKKFINDLKKREEEAQQIQRKLENLQTELAERSIKLDYLEKLRGDQKTQEQHLKQAIEAKERAYDQLNKELMTNKSLFERQQLFLETTLSNELQNKGQRENELSMQVEKLESDVKNLKNIKQDIERQLADSREHNRKLEAMTDMSQGQEISRQGWNFDLTKIDNELFTEQEKSKKLLRDNEKLRSERINDSHIIKKYQDLDQKLLGIQNKLIAQMSKFANQIERVDSLETKYPHLHKLTKVQMNFKENATGKDKDYICTNLEQLLDWMHLIQKQLKDMIIKSEKENADKGKRENEAEDTSFDLQLDLIQRDKIPEREISIRNKESFASKMHAPPQTDNPIDQVHQLDKAQDLESQLQIERDIKSQLEQCLTKLSQLLHLESQFRQTLVEFLTQSKSLYQLRMEAKMISSKLRQQEQRYSTLLQDQHKSKGIYKNELVYLKQSIEKDRLQMSHLDRKIEQVEASLTRATQELVRLDQSQHFNGQSNQERVNQLTDQLIEIKKNYNDLSQKKEWAEAKLQEIQSQMNLFDQNELGTENTLRAQMSNRRLIRRGSSKNNHQQNQDKAADGDFQMPPRPLNAFRNSRNRLSTQKLSGVDSEFERLQNESDVRKAGGSQLEAERSDQVRLLGKNNNQPDEALYKVTSPAQDESRTHLDSTDPLLSEQKNREPEAQVQNAIFVQNNDFVEWKEQRDGQIGSAGSALEQRLAQSPNGQSAYPDRQYMGTMQSSKAAQPLISKSSSKIEKGQVAERQPTSSVPARQIFAASSATTFKNERAPGEEKMNHARIPTEISVKNILMERLQSESSHIASTSRKAEAAQEAATRVNQGTPPQAQRAINDWYGAQGQLKNESAKIDAVIPSQRTEKSPNWYKRERHQISSQAEQHNPSDQLYSPNYKVTVDPPPIHPSKRDLSSKSRRANQTQHDAISDSIGGLSPHMPTYDLKMAHQQTRQQHNFRESEFQQIDRSTDVQYRHRSRSPQGTDVSRESRGQQAIDMMQLRDSEPNNMVHDDFVKMTRGNHLLPLQLQAHQSKVSYVNTYSSSYAETAKYSKPYVDTTAHHTRQSEVPIPSQFGSIVRGEETHQQMYSRDANTQPHASNLINNQFDFIDQKRLERALTPHELNSISSDPRTTQSNPQQKIENTSPLRTKAKNADLINLSSPVRQSSMHERATSGDARREVHYIASNPLRRDNRDSQASSGHRKSNNYTSQSASKQPQVYRTHDQALRAASRE